MIFNTPQAGSSLTVFCYVLKIMCKTEISFCTKQLLKNMCTFESDLENPVALHPPNLNCDTLIFYSAKCEYKVVWFGAILGRPL